MALRKKKIAGKGKTKPRKVKRQARKLAKKQAPTEPTTEEEVKEVPQNEVISEAPPEAPEEEYTPEEVVTAEESLNSQVENLFKKKKKKKTGKTGHKGFMKKLLSGVKKMTFAPLLIPLVPFIPMMKTILKKKGVTVTGANPKPYILAFYNKIVKPTMLDDSENIVEELASGVIKAVIGFISNLKKKKKDGQKLSKNEEEVLKVVEKIDKEIDEEIDDRQKKKVGTFVLSPVVLIIIAVGVIFIIKKSKQMKRKGSKKIGSMGSKIMKKAKEIRRKHPSKKWTTCVKESAKTFKK